VKHGLLIAVMITLIGSGCVTTRDSGMTIRPEVRKQSSCDDVLFRDLLTKRGGLGHANWLWFPKVKQSVVTKIEVVTPYDNKHTGVERWFVQHDDGEICVFLVKLRPDNKHETDWAVQLEKRK
jgi:hypothetical protein